MEIIAARWSCYYFFRDGRDFFVDVNGKWQSYTYRLTEAEVREYQRGGGVPYVEDLAGKLAGYEGKNAERPPTSKSMDSKAVREWWETHPR